MVPPAKQESCLSRKHWKRHENLAQGADIPGRYCDMVWRVVSPSPRIMALEVIRYKKLRTIEEAILLVVWME